MSADLAARRTAAAAVPGDFKRKAGRYIAALILAAATAAGTAACGPSSSGTAYFGTCPAGNEYPVQVTPGVWRCEG